MNPLNKVRSSADVQPVTVHFIIIGSSTSGEERDIKGVRAEEETDRSGSWEGVRQEWMDGWAETHTEGRGRGGFV